ncbi:MAG: LPS export ABC transporter periplasmic protein LptC [Bacteroidales bacterium]|nr:LPS export ABC transporter periplasmic protein LptC [Bacteroidales bacterium]
MKNKIIVLFLLFDLFVSCSSKVEQLNNYNIDATFPQESQSNVDYKYYSSHEMKTIITAPQADIYEGEQTNYYEFPQGIKVVFYDEGIKEKSTLVADYAIYYKNKRLYEARKNVVITNNDGTVLTTEQLFCDEIKQKIFSVKRVKVVQPADGFVIDGKSGFESDLTFKNYKFLDVNGSLELSQEYEEANASVE